MTTSGFVHITEAEAERRIDIAVQRRLATEPRYRNAENAESQALAEQLIEAEVVADLQSKCIIEPS